MFYKLKENFVLRAWKDLPYALIDLKTGGALFLEYKKFQALQYCNGKVDFSMPFFDDEIIKTIKKALEQGIIEECSKGESISEFQEYKEYQSRYIASVQWSITGKCNYKCRHCFMSAPEINAPELSHEEIMHIIDELSDCGVMRVQLTGGEPLIRKDFLEIVDALLARKINISQIYSNGYLVNERLLRELDKRKIYPEFNMSFDGVGWHDWLRGINGAEERVNNAFKLCREMGFPTGCEMTIHKGNKNLLRASINHLASLGVEHVKVSAVSKVGEWTKHNDNKSINLPELFKAYLDYLPDYYADGMPLRILFSGFFMADPRRPDEYIIIGYDDENFNPDETLVCGHARTTSYISPEGRVLSCIPLSGLKVQEKFPFVTQNKLSDCLNSPEYLSLVKMKVSEFLNSKAKCRSCKFTKHCKGGCFAVAFISQENGEANPNCELFYGGWIKKIVEVVSKARLSAKCPVSDEEILKG